MRHGLQQLQQLGVAVVGDAALLGKVVVVGRDELAHGHDAGRLALQQVDDLPAELDELRVPHRTLAALDPRLCRRRTVGVQDGKRSTVCLNVIDRRRLLCFLQVYQSLVLEVCCGST